MNILIVGAGPAGLALANFLNSQKHTVMVLEEKKEFSTMGFGIFFFNEGKRLLRKATHDKTIHRFLKQIGFKRYLTDHGEILGDTHYNRMFHVNNYDAVTSIKREDLHRLLREHLPETVQLKMDTTIATIENNPHSVVVTFSDASTSTFDLVVGADGVHSKLREKFFSYRIETLPWTARYFWLNKTLPRFLMEWSRTATIMCMPHASCTTVLSIEYSRPNASKPVSDELLEFYASIGLSRKELHECYTKSYASPMQYVHTKQWFVNRVVLIGDAQHAMTPTLGFGTSSALEDAYELAMAMNSLDSSANIEATLRTFAKKRTRKIRVLRSLNRLTDFLVYRRSKVYFRFWYKHHFLAVRISQIVDGLIRLGWRYG